MKDKTLKSRIKEGKERLNQLKVNGENPILTRDWSADLEEQLRKALEGGMNPNIDIINDFSKLQATNNALGKSNVDLAGKLIFLQRKINNLKAHEVYSPYLQESVPLERALEYLDDNVDCNYKTVNDLLDALKNLLKE